MSCKAQQDLIRVWEKMGSILYDDQLYERYVASIDQREYE